jgi:hypothetical protein
MHDHHLLSKEIGTTYIHPSYMSKTLNQIIFFSLHQNQNIFFSNIGIQNIFLEKKHNRPLQVKWSFPYYSSSFEFTFKIRIARRVLQNHDHGHAYSMSRNLCILRISSMCNICLLRA